MVMRFIVGFSVAAALALGGAADAQSLRDARARDANSAALADEAYYTRKVCGNEIRAEVDWASAGDWQEGLLIAECDKALGALEAACRAGDIRAQGVTRFICAGDGDGAELRGSLLRYGADRRANAFVETQSALGAKK